jgi:hypothetical protein
MAETVNIQHDLHTIITKPKIICKTKLTYLLLQSHLQMGMKFFYKKATLAQMVEQLICNQ